MWRWSRCGQENTEYAQYFTGTSYLSMLSTHGVVIGNVTFAPVRGCLFAARYFTAAYGIPRPSPAPAIRWHSSRAVPSLLAFSAHRLLEIVGFLQHHILDLHAASSPGTSTARWINQSSFAAPCQCFTRWRIGWTVWSSHRPLRPEYRIRQTKGDNKNRTAPHSPRCRK